MPQSTESRTFLMKLFDAAVTAAHPGTCVPPFLPAVPESGRIIVVGAGKAAAAMAQATERHYMELGQADRISGSVTTRHGYGLPTEIIEVVEAGHPVPDQMSVETAQRALQRAGEAEPGDLVLALMSGGASALWSAPADGITFDAKQNLTKQLLRSGARITEMNCIRKHLSAIKGGKLAAAVGDKTALLTLAISDIPGDDPAAIGSGPTIGDPTTLQEAREILNHYGIDVAPEIQAVLADEANETLKPDDARLAHARFEIVAAPRQSIAAAAAIAQAAGYEVVSLGDALEGEAREVASEHARLALEAKAAGKRIAIMSGGELTVTIRGDGTGGPNQEYALAVAIALDGAQGISALAGDTDGTDGGAGSATDPAGAIVLPDTLQRASAANLNAAKFLDNNDSTAFFRAIGDLVECGPTQTNVNDFRVILVDP